MVRIGWGEERLYADGEGSWNKAPLPPVPAIFDDNIYSGIDLISDPLYDNNRGRASRGDQDIYDNRPGSNPVGYSEQGIYDNSVGSSGRKDEGETEYDNCPKMESEDYLEGLLKQNIYDNNLRDKLPVRVSDQTIYDNMAEGAPSDPQDKFAFNGYNNISKHADSIVENAYEIGETIYDNKDGDRGDREEHEGVYDNNPIQSKQALSPREDCQGEETSPAFGESPYDNCANSLVPEQVDETYTKMESVRRLEGTGMFVLITPWIRRYNFNLLVHTLYGDICKYQL